MLLEVDYYELNRSLISPLLQFLLLSYFSKQCAPVGNSISRCQTLVHMKSGVVGVGSTERHFNTHHFLLLVLVTATTHMMRNVPCHIRGGILMWASMQLGAVCLNLMKRKKKFIYNKLKNKILTKKQNNNKKNNPCSCHLLPLTERVSCIAGSLSGWWWW